MDITATIHAHSKEPCSVKLTVARWFSSLVLVAATTPAVGAPTLIENVHGYSLVVGRLQRFDALLFDGGKVLATGNAASLRRDHAGGAHP